MVTIDSKRNIEYYVSGLLKTKDRWLHQSRRLNFYEIILMHKGIAYIAEDDVEYTLHENDLLIMEPGKFQHGFKHSEEPISFSWFCFRTNPEKYSNLPKFMHVSEPHMLKMLLSQCQRLTSIPTYDPVCADLYAALIIEEILKLKKTADLSSNFLASQIREWIITNIEKDITIKNIAKEFNYHENHISRMFSTVYGTGLSEYITKLRIENAQNLLFTTTYSLNQIAQIMSFKSENHFIKFFKYHTKMTPTEYRHTVLFPPSN